MSKREEINQLKYKMENTRDDIHMLDDKIIAILNYLDIDLSYGSNLIAKKREKDEG